MEELIPFFEVKGQRFEIKRTRYLLAELDKFGESNGVTNEEENAYNIYNEKVRRLLKLQDRFKELEDKYYLTFSEEDEDMYKRAKKAYEELYAEVSDYQTKAKDSITKIAKTALDRGEQLLLIALQHDLSGKEIRTYDEASEIWCEYVNEVGTGQAQEFIISMVNYLSGDNEDTKNPFVKQMRAKAKKGK